MKFLYALLIPVCACGTVSAQNVPVVGPGRAVDPFHYSIQKSASFTKGAVSSAHPLASLAGAEILRRGGNAFDAAITTQLVLAVVYPGAGNIGGGGFLVAHRSGGENISIDYRETGPSKATRDMYLDKNGNVVPKLSQAGHLASGVPGTVAGLFATAEYASMPFRTLIQPAIDLAENGFVLTEHEAAGLNATRESFIRNSTRPSAFLRDTKWKAGDTLIQKELAATLKRIRDLGKKGFYEGETARLIAEEMKRGGGIITADDLLHYTAKKRTALEFTYKGYTIVGMPPPSSGGIIVWQLMKMMEKKPLANYGFESVESVHLMAEAERRAFADRAEHMGDPDFWKVPVAGMTNESYLQNRMNDFDAAKATPSGNVTAGQIKESEQTTHFSIMDGMGNMVSVTTTLNGGYGSRTVVGGAGFLMNNEMDDFSAKPGVPNMYGAVGGDANAIAAGKRMLSSMTPTLVLKDRQPFVVAGTPGGTTIPTSVFQTLVDIIDYHMSAPDAVNKPKFHHQWLPDELDVEKGFPEEVRKKLEAMGYTIKERSGIGRTEVIKILKDGKRETAADIRGDDSVAGY